MREGISDLEQDGAICISDHVKCDRRVREAAKCGEMPVSHDNRLAEIRRASLTIALPAIPLATWLDVSMPAAVNIAADLARMVSAWRCSSVAGG